MCRAIERLRLQSTEWGIELESAQITLLGAYADLLANYERANVIGTRDRDQIVLGHILDALSCLLVSDFYRVHSVVDVGTGAGLPGIPLTIARPDLHVTLLEATLKKAHFLQHAREMLSLPNTEVLHARAEEVGARTHYREVFELATTRALASLPVVSEYCAPLVRPGGTVLAMKGRLPRGELPQGVSASRELGMVLREVRQVKHHAGLPQKERSLVVFDKVAPTAGAFPRRPGLAKKRPLGAWYDDEEYS